MSDRAWPFFIFSGAEGGNSPVGVLAGFPRGDPAGGRRSWTNPGPGRRETFAFCIKREQTKPIREASADPPPILDVKPAAADPIPGELKNSTPCWKLDKASSFSDVNVRGVFASAGPGPDPTPAARPGSQRKN